MEHLPLPEFENDLSNYYEGDLGSIPLGTVQAPFGWSGEGNPDAQLILWEDNGSTGTSV